MKKQIVINGKKIDYILRVSRRARRVRLAIYYDGNFVVSAPIGISERTIEKFIIRKGAWVIDKMEYFKSHPRQVIKVGSRKDFKEYQREASRIAFEKIQYFNEYYGFKYGRLTIRNQKTRWGSCSKKGNLNFNYKIALLPTYLVDYIIVHELCHLKEFNHSKKFWNLVAVKIPDFKSLRSELRKTGIQFK